MKLQNLIDFLKERDPNQKVKFGFSYPHSYRGDYRDLAFVPQKDTTVGEMLTCAKSAMNETFTGWKGGDFTMYEFTQCWLANVGESSEETLGPTLLAFMLEEEPKF